MSSGLRSTEYLNNNSNNTTTTGTSTLPNTEPSLSLKRTTPGWFLQWTRGWPWSSWTKRIIPTRPKHYYMTPTHTNCSPRILPPNSKINSSPFLKTLNKQEASPPKNTNNFTPPVQFSLNFMACPKYTKQVPPSGPLFPVGGPSHMVLPRSYHTSSNPL